MVQDKQVKFIFVLYNSIENSGAYFDIIIIYLSLKHTKDFTKEKKEKQKHILSKNLDISANSSLSAKAILFLISFHPLHLA